MKYIARIAVVLATAATLSACGSGAITVRGTLENTNKYDPANPTASHTWVADTTHKHRCLDDETIDVVTTIDGRSVTLARGHTDEGHSVSGGPLGSAEGMNPCFTDFTIRGVPGGHGSYGLRVEGVPGTANFTATQLGKRLSLSFGPG